MIKLIKIKSLRPLLQWILAIPAFAMKNLKDEIIFIVGVFSSYIFVRLLPSIGDSSLWISLLILTSSAFYYSYTFFSSNQKIEKLYYFVIVTFLIIFYFSLVYYAVGIVDTSSGEVIKHDWLNSIYFSVITWTTLGYGDFKPFEELKVWVMIEALMGYLFMALIVAKILTIFQSKKPKI
jgi:hypothetical protein